MDKEYKMRRNLTEILEKSQLLITDGAAGTHLENLGCDLNDDLWTAKILKDAPQLIKQLHRDYFEAGSDFGVTVSYQATIEGYVKKGLTRDEAIEVIKASASLLLEAREEWWNEQGKAEGRLYPIAAASIGPYGAFLADGSEYRGDYELTNQELRDFHKERIELLWNQGVELIAAETIPRLDEALVIAEIVQELGAQCWMTFSAKNETEISNGQNIEECIEALESFSNVVAVGVNCTAPKYIDSLVKRINSVTSKPIVVYGNLGDSYDPDTKTWCSHQGSGDDSYTEHAQEWKASGASIVGGCCGTTPKDILSISQNRNKFKSA